MRERGIWGDTAQGRVGATGIRTGMKTCSVPDTESLRCPRGDLPHGRVLEGRGERGWRDLTSEVV